MKLGLEPLPSTTGSAFEGCSELTTELCVVKLNASICWFRTTVVLIMKVTDVKRLWKTLVCKCIQHLLFVKNLYIKSKKHPGGHRSGSSSAEMTGSVLRTTVGWASWRSVTEKTLTREKKQFV